MTEGNHHISTLGAFNLAAISAALVLLGPGAFHLMRVSSVVAKSSFLRAGVHFVDDPQEHSALH